jgi:eukaryotic-like serine/threonine-protein kinase
MSENLVGKILKQHYFLEKKLGSSGFGTTYLAKDTFSAIGGTYIVKHFSPQYTNEAQLATGICLFKQEADSLQKLGNHPQIPRIYDFFIEENDFFLVQEFIEGQNLQQELDEIQYFKQAQTIKLLTDTLEVLKFIHKAEYIHQDIKPSNLIRNRFDNRFFIINCGAIKEKIDPQNINIQGNNYLESLGILNPGYTPNEQLYGQPQFCSDIYALGMVAVQALTGEYPGSLLRNTNLKLMWRDRLQPYFNYDVNFLDLIDKMIEQDWQKRYQSATAVLTDLSSINAAQATVIIAPVKTVGENNVKTEQFDKAKLLKKQLNFHEIFKKSGIIGAIAIFLGILINNFHTEKFATYENEQIKIDYPIGWLQEYDSNSSSTSVRFISPKENNLDQFQEQVTITIKESPQPLSLTEYTQQAVRQIESFSNFVLSHPRKIEFAKSEGKSIIYQGKDKNTKVKRQEVWTVNYQTIYSIIYTAESDKFEKFLPQAETMIESLEILE